MKHYPPFVPGSSHEQGFSLPGLMIGVLITGVIVSMMTVNLTGSMKRMYIMINSADRRDLRLYLSSATDCAKTKVAWPACNSATSPFPPYISIKNRANTNLIAVYDGVTSTTIGKLSVRASCNAGQILFEYRLRTTDPWAALYTPTQPPFSCVYP